MESGIIEDSQLSASSSFDVMSVGPQNARYKTIKVYKLFNKGQRSLANKCNQDCKNLHLHIFHNKSHEQEKRKKK